MSRRHERVGRISLKAGLVAPRKMFFRFSQLHTSTRKKRNLHIEEKRRTFFCALVDSVKNIDLFTFFLCRTWENAWSRCIASPWAEFYFTMKHIGFPASRIKHLEWRIVQGIVFSCTRTCIWLIFSRYFIFIAQPNKQQGWRERRTEKDQAKSSAWGGGVYVIIFITRICTKFPWKTRRTT